MEKKWNMEFASYHRKYTKQDLMKMCETRQLTGVGRKHDLIQRILTYDSGNEVYETPLVIPKPIVQIQKMAASGNWIHRDSGFIFDPESRKVIGVETEDGSIRSLCVADLEECKRYKFNYDSLFQD